MNRDRKDRERERDRDKRQRQRGTQFKREGATIDTRERSSERLATPPCLFFYVFCKVKSRSFFSM